MGMNVAGEGKGKSGVAAMQAGLYTRGSCVLTLVVLTFPEYKIEAIKDSIP